MRKYLYQSLVCFILLAAGIIPAQVYGLVNTISDTTVERLMNHFLFREVCTDINRKLKTISAKEVDRLLYYHNKISLAQLRIRNLDSALAMAKVSLSLIPRSKDSVLIADAWRITAYAYNNAGNLDSALFYTQLMLGYAERKGDEKQLRNALVSMATIMNQNRQFNQALKYNRSAAALTRKIHDTLNYALGGYNLGLTFQNLQQYDSSLFYLKNAKDAAIKTRQMDLLIYIYGAMADLYLSTGNETERKKYLLLAKTEAEKMGNSQFLAMFTSNLMQDALEKKNYAEAIRYAKEAQLHLSKQPYPVLQVRIDSMSWVAYNKMGDLTHAMECLLAFQRGKEMLVSGQQKGQLDKMALTLDVKEKDLTIANQNLEIAQKKRRIEVLSLLFLLAVLMTIAMFIYFVNMRSFRRKLFLKEKELDQFTVDVRNWMEWKNTQKRDIETVEAFKDVAGDETVSEVQIQAALFTELREVFERQKLYLDPELNLKTVIRILGTNKKYLYKAISENSNNNFRAFINRYRVDEAKRLIEQKILIKDELDLSEIYAAAGFNSLVSFYRAFKLVTGLAPKHYADEARRELKQEAGKKG
jgi:AraC-like DNA-binding protein